MLMDMRHDQANPDRKVMGPLCQVSLIDRRTGHPLRLNGALVAVLSRQPQRAAAELLQGRDASLWQIKVSPLESGARQ